MDFRLNLDPDPSGPARRPGPSGVHRPPERLLRRHDAWMFEPGAGRHPTAYRRTALLVSEVVAHPASSAIRNAMNEALRNYGMQIAEPPPEHYDEPRPDRHVAVRIVAISGDDSDVDALVALRALREASWRFPDDVGRYLREVFMDRLLFAARAPGDVESNGPATAGHGDPADGDVVVPGSGYGRTPVMLPVPPPPSGAGSAVDRPVVAILDSGLGRNEWLGTDEFGQSTHSSLVNDNVIQDRIRDAMLGERANSPDLIVLADQCDASMPSDRVVGGSGLLQGHGTFNAGVVRQLSGDAIVLVIRIMYSDGVVYESAAVKAMNELVDRLGRAGGEQRSHLPDVVLLPFGGYFDDESAETRGSLLFPPIEALRANGVIVVAAAGNDATTQRCYPAALAGFPSAADVVPVISVGACNPNGTQAMFSNAGPWVNCWASGVSLISTVPRDLNGPRTPRLHFRPANGRTIETVDPDSFGGGWASWSGTSFAAAVAAAVIANQLLRVGGLADVSADARRTRALQALRELHESTSETGPVT